MEGISSGSHIQARCEIHCRQKVTRHMRCRPTRAPARLPFMSVQIQMQVHPPSLPVPPCVPTSAQASRACEARPGVWTRTPLTLQHSHPASGQWQGGRVASNKKAQARCPGGQASKSGRRGWSRSRCRTVAEGAAV